MRQMKRTFLTCIITLVGTCLANLSAQEYEGVVFLEGKTFTEAVDLARKYNKKVFLDCYTSWCGPCKMVARDIFPQKIAGDYFNREFVNIKIDMEKGEGPELAKRFGVKAYPTFIMFDGEGKEIGRLVGGKKNAEEFVAAVKDAVGENSLSAMTQRYDDGERNREFLYDYLVVLGNAYQSDKAEAVAAEILDGKAEELLDDERLFNTFLRYNSSPMSPAFQYVLQHEDEFKSQYPNSKLDRMIASAWMSYPRTLLKRNADGTVTFDRKAMKAYAGEMKKWNVENREEIILLSDINVAEATQDWREYAKLCSKYIKKFGENDMYIYNWALRMQRECQDAKAKRVAVGWMQKRLESIRKEEARLAPPKEGEVRAYAMNGFSKAYEDLIEKMR